MSSPHQLQYVRPAIQNYAWGCKGGGLVATSADVNGLRVDSSKEYAEAWFGTHTSAPSLLVDVEGDKTTPLSPSLDLPLLKILAIRAPLSIQLHPDSGIAPFLHTRFSSVYKDPSAKPEMVIPITPLLVMMGVKEYGLLRKSIAAIPAVAEFIGTEMQETTNADIRETEVIRVLSKWLHLSAEQAKPLVQKALDQLETISCTDLIAKDAIQHLQKHFPLDVGVLAPVFLNVLRLAPGQALFVPPNVLHAYIDGDAVEIMNSSDNVIRAGLTPKLRDADLLCKLLFADETGTAVNAGQPTVPFTRVYRPVNRVRDFELSAVELPSNQKTTLEVFPITSLLLCTGGSATVTSHNSLSLAPGQCVLIPAGVAVEVTAKENGTTVYRANKNQGPLPDDTIVSSVFKTIFEELPKLQGEELKKKALKAADDLRTVELYLCEIWVRAAAYFALGNALAKSAATDAAVAYSASRWLQKVVYICDLAGDAANDTPIKVHGTEIVPSKIKAEATATLATLAKYIAQK